MIQAIAWLGRQEFLVASYISGYVRWVVGHRDQGPVIIPPVHLAGHTSRFWRWYSSVGSAVVRSSGECYWGL